MSQFGRSTKIKKAKGALPDALEDSVAAVLNKSLYFVLAIWSLYAFCFYIQSMFLLLYGFRIWAKIRWFSFEILLYVFF